VGAADEGVGGRGGGIVGEATEADEDVSAGEEAEPEDGEVDGARGGVDDEGCEGGVGAGGEGGGGEEGEDRGGAVSGVLQGSAAAVTGCAQRQRVLADQELEQGEVDVGVSSLVKGRPFSCV